MYLSLFFDTKNRLLNKLMIRLHSIYFSSFTVTFTQIAAVGRFTLCITHITIVFDLENQRYVS